MLGHKAIIGTFKKIRVMKGIFYAKIGSIKDRNGRGLQKQKIEEAVLRWRRNRTGRPLSPLQIHQKNI